jgi:endonuclease YncB( thermonuclease family)
MKKVKEKRVWILSIFALLFILIVVWAIYKNTFVAPDTQIVRIIDGDTFELYQDKQVVRLLCVDTPESGEEGYEEAKTFLGSLIIGNDFFMNSSTSGSNDTDAYGRLLKWVYIVDEDGEQILISKLIINEGYGELMIIPPETCREITEIIVD